MKRGEKPLWLRERIFCVINPISGDLFLGVERGKWASLARGRFNPDDPMYLLCSAFHFSGDSCIYNVRFA